MADLSDRQLHILKAVIEEYIDTAEAVGSDTLDKKYNLGVSPATIRNEMVKLTTAGYLKQPHTSAGRTPTPAAMKLYVNRLMKAKELSITDEVTVKQKIWDHREELDTLLREATRALAAQTKTMSVAATDEGMIFSSGMGNILDMPEFFDIDITRHLLDTLDENAYWWNLMSQCQADTTVCSLLLGEDLGSKYLMEVGGVFIRFSSSSHQGAIGIVGPTRLNFPKVIPLVQYMGGLINDIAKNL